MTGYSQLPVLPPATRRISPDGAPVTSLRRIRLRPAAWVVLALVAAALCALTIWAVSYQKPATGRPAEAMFRPPALPQPQDVRPLTAQQAAELNSSVPVSGSDVPAKPFGWGADSVSRSSALDCLTAAIYYEAASEGLDGQRAVAQVVLNRVRHPAYPRTVCGVVYQGAERTTGCQFTFTCDGSLARKPSRSAWDQARKVASAALSGDVFNGVGHSTHYHTVWVVPYWAPRLEKSATIGAHIFYRWPGAWGKPRAFSQRYSGLEPDVGRLVEKLTAAEGEALPVAPIGESGGADSTASAEGRGAADGPRPATKTLLADVQAGKLIYAPAEPRPISRAPATLAGTNDPEPGCQVAAAPAAPTGPIVPKVQPIGPNQRGC